MLSEPVVSVMVPVYNTRRFLAATIEGILGQSFREFELIAIDDGSTDGSAELLNQYAARDPRVRVIARSNKGIVRTRNELLAEARGEFVAVNDSDDISLPSRLGRQVEFLGRNPDVVCVGGYFDLIDSAGRMLTTLRPPCDDPAVQDALLAGHCAICHSCGMFRRDAAEKVGGYQTQYTYAHDLDLWLRLGEVGKLANLSQTVLRFRLHDKSISQSRRIEQRRFAQIACEEACRRRGVTRGFEAADPWRAGEDRASKHQYALQYGWWAFNSGQRRTALVYGAKAVAAMPLSSRGWRLIASAALKPVGTAS